jgi:hypothetical protein
LLSWSQLCSGMNESTLVLKAEHTTGQWHNRQGQQPSYLQPWQPVS